MKTKHWVIALLLWFACIQTGWSFYNPTTGKWLTRDPVGESGGVSVYGFVGNDPTDKTDRLGLDINVITAPVTFDTGKCCEKGAMVNKVSVYIVNRGSPVNQQGSTLGMGWTGGHIDLVVPGCGIGMVGFYANQTSGWPLSYPGTENIELGDWTRSAVEGGRIDYLAPEGGLMINTPTGPVKVPAGIRSYICEIKVCPEDAKKMCQRAQQIRSSPDSFNIVGRNCSSMGCDILNAGGAGPNGISGIDNPQALQSQLGSKNCFYGYTGLKPDGQISVQRATNQSPPPAPAGSSH